MDKRRLGFWEIWNMSFGFLGIQFGFMLQGGNYSRIFQTLGAEKDAIPMLWIAAPLTGLIIQPIIGYLSDRTWHPRWGRRRPYFLIGAVFASLALIVAPFSPFVWVAAGCLWILDASMNVSMEPFRALVADKLNEDQRSYGFVMQALIIGIGTFVAGFLPAIINALGVSNVALEGSVPMNVKLAFVIGGVILFGSILYTVLTTKEYPPEDMEAFKKEKEATRGLGHGINEVFSNIFSMPRTMFMICIVQFFSWFAFFTMWNYATIGLSEHVYDSPEPKEELFVQADFEAERGMYVDEYVSKAAEDSILYLSSLKTANVDSVLVLSKLEEYGRSADKEQFVRGNLHEVNDYSVWYCVESSHYNDAADKVGAAMGVYGLSSMVFALLLTFYTRKKRINRKLVHLASLCLGGLGFILMYYVKTDMALALCFALIGFSWGSILSMPYAMLSSSINPNKMGVYMGIFNMFIVIPQIIAALGGLNLAYKVIFGEATINAMLLAGSSLIIAGLANLLITNPKAIR